MSFNSKVVLITGGSSGLGAATVIMFAKEGANVVIVDRNDIELKNTLAECEKVGKIPLFIKADVSKDEDVYTIIKQTIDTYGKLDVLVNNAGVLKFASIASGKLLEVFDEIMAVNLRAVVSLTTLATPYLRKTKGNIVNISSIVGVNRVADEEYTLAFGVSKYCLNHFSKCAAAELGSVGIRVNTICPGAINTNMLNKSVCKYSRSDYIRHSALKKICEPEEFAGLTLFLANAKAKSITGANYAIDNGMKIRK